jgi:homoserine dehydrogenase
MRVALIGFGNVGKAFIRLIYDKRAIIEKNGISLEIISIFNSRGGMYCHKGIPLNELIDTIESNDAIENSAFYNSLLDIDYVIENGNIDMAVIVTPTNIITGEPGLTYITKLLSKGINVVTGDKGPILLKYNELKSLAKKNNCNLGIGCTTGGALPSINTGLIDLAGANITEIKGVLNGTSNYIINEMEENNLTFQEALTKAQVLGIAESNPTLDIGGYDTATKLVIIFNALLTNNKTLKDVSISGISKITKEEIQFGKSTGYKYKLVGKCKQVCGDWELTVALEKISFYDSLYNVDGKNKAVQFKTDTLGDITVMGGASGTTPAAASLLRDIINMKKGINFIDY